MKQCGRCRKPKEDEDFALRAGRRIRQSWCRLCMAIYNRVIRYGITEEQYQQMLKTQEYKCAICDKLIGESGCVDHDHSCCPGERTCGKCIRGIVCQNCNHGLGLFHDDRYILTKAIEYISRFKK